MFELGGVPPIPMPTHHLLHYITNHSTWLPHPSLAYSKRKQEEGRPGWGLPSPPPRSLLLLVNYTEVRMLGVERLLHQESPHQDLSQKAAVQWEQDICGMCLGVHAHISMCADRQGDRQQHFPRSQQA